MPSVYMHSLVVPGTNCQGFNNWSEDLTDSLAV